MKISSFTTVIRDREYASTAPTSSEESFMRSPLLFQVSPLTCSLFKTLNYQSTRSSSSTQTPTSHPFSIYPPPCYPVLQYANATTKSMALFFLSTLANLCGDLLSRHALLLYAATWTAVVTAAVAVAAFTPELAFVWAVSPSSPLSQACEGLGPMGLVGSVGLPLDGPPWEMVCIPAHFFDRSNVDVFIPPLFAVVVVAVAVCFTRAIGIWEEDEDEETST